MKESIHCELISESTLLVRFGEHISENLLDTIKQGQLCAQKVFGFQLRDMVASYTTLMIEFDPLLMSPWQAKLKFQRAWDTRHQQSVSGDSSPSGSLNSPLFSIEKTVHSIEIPVYYHPSVGWDLETIAQEKGLSWQQVVDIHCQRAYRVYAMGFAPGFAFMAELDARLEMPRKKSPRKKVPAGSVAISDLQTSVYPKQSPGGWNIIGRSPLALFNSDKSPSAILRTADTVTFKAITREQFIALGGSLDDLDAGVDDLGVGFDDLGKKGGQTDG